MTDDERENVARAIYEVCPWWPGGDYSEITADEDAFIPFADAPSYDQQTCREMADAAIAAYNTMRSEWITLEDWRSVPRDDETEYWFWLVPKPEFEAHTFPAVYRHAWHGKPGNWSSVYRATHYQPFVIPEPPKDAN